MFEKALLLSVCTEAFFVGFFFSSHPKKARQEIHQLSGTCDSRLSAHCLATHTTQGSPGITYAATSHPLILALMPTASYIRLLTREIPSCPSVSAGPVSSRNGTTRNSNRTVYPGSRFTYNRSHNILAQNFMLGRNSALMQRDHQAP